MTTRKDKTRKRKMKRRKRKRKSFRHSGDWLLNSRLLQQRQLPLADVVVELAAALVVVVEFGSFRVSALPNDEPTKMRCKKKKRKTQKNGRRLMRIKKIIQKNWKKRVSKKMWMMLLCFLLVTLLQKTGEEEV